MRNKTAGGRLRVAGALLAVAAGVLVGCAGSGAQPLPPSSQAAQREPAAVLAPVSVTASSEASTNESGKALPSWTDGPSRTALETFVGKVTASDGPGFVPRAERIAVFDNDGTLWGEQPLYVQLAFTLDRMRQLAPEHPEWSTKQPYKAALDGDAQAILSGGFDNWFKLVLATHAGMTSEEFSNIVSNWMKTARHPQHQRPYTELAYAPMLELVEYLRAHGFKNYIVSGGGLEFMRPWTQATYGIPPEQVIGSRVKTKWEEGSNGPVLRRLPEVGFINDGPGKPVAIYESIGRRPIFAAGHSDGDLQML
jgi:phosphoglycolate phosphatase-like HAD superfamily hydrolase